MLISPHENLLQIFGLLSLHSFIENVLFFVNDHTFVNLRKKDADNGKLTSTGTQVQQKSERNKTTRLLKGEQGGQEGGEGVGRRKSSIQNNSNVQISKYANGKSKLFRPQHDENINQITPNIPHQTKRSARISTRHKVKDTIETLLPTDSQTELSLTSGDVPVSFEDLIPNAEQLEESVPENQQCSSYSPTTGSPDERETPDFTNTTNIPFLDDVLFLDEKLQQDEQTHRQQKQQQQQTSLVTELPNFSSTITNSNTASSNQPNLEGHVPTVPTDNCDLELVNHKSIESLVTKNIDLTFKATYAWKDEHVEKEINDHQLYLSEHHSDIEKGILKCILFSDAVMSQG